MVTEPCQLANWGNILQAGSECVLSSGQGQALTIMLSLSCSVWAHLDAFPKENRNSFSKERFCKLGNHLESLPSIKLSSYFLCGSPQAKNNKAMRTLQVVLEVDVYWETGDQVASYALLVIFESHELNFSFPALHMRKLRHRPIT